MTSDPGRSLTGMWARGRTTDLGTDEAWLRAMMEVEVALARAAASAGLISKAHARQIGQVVAGMALDVDAIGEEASATGTPIVPLVRRLRAAVDDDVAESVHRGATSQDIVDTATMLIAHRSLMVVIEDLAGASDAAAKLALAHRDTPIAGRTLLQQASPTTFGLKAATWMVGLDRSIDRLHEIQGTVVAVQLGGAVGTMAAFDGRGRQIAAELARQLGLGATTVPWHTERTRVGEMAGALGVAAGAVAKPAQDVVLLAQTEVGEVEEGVAGRGGSSTMPQKHNPIAAISALACARRAPGLVTTLLGSMAHELERAAGSWHTEWVALRELLVVVGSGSAWLRDSLEHLVVKPDAMATNLSAHGGAIMAERIVEAVGKRLGRSSAADLVSDAITEVGKGSSFLDALERHDRGRSGLDRAAYTELLDPATYLGEAPALVDDALRAHEGRLAT